MQLNMEKENTQNGASDQASSSDDGQFLVALRKMMKREVEVVVIRTVQQVIVPIIGDMVRTIVKEEIQSVEKRLFTRNANEDTVSKERLLQLKLSDEVFDPVLTGKPLKAKGGNSLKVELVDKTTGQVVKDKPISCAKVEILILDASDDDNWTLENFNNRIIREGDKKRPHFAKNVYIQLEGGVGVLSNVKLGHDSKWMKNCKCRLGARIMENFRGVNVQEAITGSFTAVDCRSKQYKKNYPPSLPDKVWRLENIARDGAPCKRLNDENVETVEDFLFLLSVDPDRLQKLVGAGAKWKATVDHARTCVIDDDKVFLHYPSTESKKGVVFDAVGGLKGIINDSHYVPLNHLSADEKASANKLLLSAFDNREARSSFDDEASVLKQYPYRSSDINSLSVSEHIDGHYPVEPVTSSSSNDAYIRPLGHPNNIDHFASTDTGQVYRPVFDVPMPFRSCPFPDPSTSSQSTTSAFGIPNNILHFGDPNLGKLHEPRWDVQSPNYDFESLADDWSLMSLINSGSNNLSEILKAVVYAKLFVLRVKKRVMLPVGDIHACKKQKT